MTKLQDASLAAGQFGLKLDNGETIGLVSIEMIHYSVW